MRELGNNTDDFLARMIIFLKLIIHEMLEIRGDLKYYDSQDNGKLFRVISTIGKFIVDSKKDLAIKLHNLIMDLDENIYVPGLSKYCDMVSNIHNDIWYIHSFLDDWCVCTGNYGIY